MPNLYVFDKDGTLVHPRKDGYVSYPEDQVLYEGVREKLDRLRSEGHTLAIASNQGGCDWHEVKAVHLVIGSKFRPTTHCENFTVTSIEPSPVTDKDLLIKVVNHDDDDREYDMILSIDETVLMQHKTIEGAIAEMQFAADLCGIERAAFCPVMDGSTMRSMMSIGGVWGSCPITVAGFEGVFRCIVNFRKPHGGMLTHAQKTGTRTHFDRRIMIGDRDSDRESAISAGFEFIWAEDWRNDQEADRSGEPA